MEPNLENVKPKPVLVSRFDDIRKNPEINPTLDEFSDIFSDESYRQHSFQEAKKAFEFVFDKEKFIHHLQQKPNGTSVAYLKKIRRYGLILKAMYKFMDSSHYAEEGLQKFLFSLGEYNDQYWMPSPEQTKRGLDIIDHLNDIELSISFVHTEGFKEYTKSILSGIEIFLKEAQLPIEKFHKLRKNLRLLSNLMQVAAAENYEGNLHWLFYSLFPMSFELGQVHDDLVEKGLHGEIDYHKSIVDINPQLVIEFEKLKPFMEKVFGLRK